MRRPLIYLMTEPFAPTVIESQVVDTLAVLRQRDLVFDLLALVSPRVVLRDGRAQWRRARRHARRTGGTVGLLPAAPARRGGVAVAAVTLHAWIGPPWRRPVVVHARAHWAAAIATSLRRLRPGTRVVYDVRGDALAEYRMAAEQGDRGARAIASIAAAAIGRAARQADAMLCVSHVLADRMVARHGAHRDRIAVVPCLADETKFRFDPRVRARMRRAHGLQARRVVVFAGSTGRWHHLEATLAAMATLLAHDRRAFFLGLTPDVAELRAMADRRLPAGRWQVRHVPHAEVADWLAASDAAVLLRARHPVNEVAAPTKFAEYALCGLPVLISEGIGDYSARVRRTGWGIVLDDPPGQAWLPAWDTLMARVTEAARQRHAADARIVLGKQAGVATLEGVYRRLLDALPARP